MMAFWQNQIHYGDHLGAQQRCIPAQSVDLVYLDPPFNSRQDYSVLFAEKNRSKLTSQIRAFIKEKALKRDPSIRQKDFSLFATQAN